MKAKMLLRFWKKRYELSFTPMQQEILTVKIQAAMDSARAKGIQEGKRIVRQGICDAGNYAYQREAVVCTDSL